MSCVSILCTLSSVIKKIHHEHQSMPISPFPPFEVNMYVHNFFQGSGDIQVVIIGTYFNAEPCRWKFLAVLRSVWRWLVFHFQSIHVCLMTCNFVLLETTTQGLILKEGFDSSSTSGSRNFSDVVTDFRPFERWIDLQQLFDLSIHTPYNRNNNKKDDAWMGEAHRLQDKLHSCGKITSDFFRSLQGWALVCTDHGMFYISLSIRHGNFCDLFHMCGMQIQSSCATQIPWLTWALGNHAMDHP